MRLFILSILLISLVYSASIKGEIFNGDNFNHLNNTVITLEDENGTNIIQQLFNNNYEVTAQHGSYTLRAYSYLEGKLEYYIEQKIQISKDSTQFDLVLLPYELASFVPESNSPVYMNITDFKNLEPTKSPFNFDYAPILIGIILVLILIVVYLFFNSRKSLQPKDESTKTKKEPEVTYELDEDGKKVLKILSEQEGRIQQKELRDILNFSEAKMSLLLSELEVNGYIKRIKKGRDNIIKLTTSEQKEQ